MNAKKKKIELLCEEALGKIDEAILNIKEEKMQICLLTC